MRGRQAGLPRGHKNTYREKNLRLVMKLNQKPESKTDVRARNTFCLVFLDLS